MVLLSRQTTPRAIQSLKTPQDDRSDRLALSVCWLGYAKTGIKFLSTLIETPAELTFKHLIIVIVSLWRTERSEFEDNTLHFHSASLQARAAEYKNLSGQLLKLSINKRLPKEVRGEDIIQFTKYHFPAQTQV